MVAVDRFNLGLVWANKGDYRMAANYFEKALVVIEQRLGPDHQFTQSVLLALQRARNSQ